MDVIRNYVEAMFCAYPRTPEMERAKKELTAMMEDKYGELIREGYNQNEAVGIVIAEFGNLEEIMRDYGPLEDGMDGDRRMGEDDIRCVTYREAVEYIQDMEKTGTKMGLGVWLCIASPSILFVLLGLWKSGILLLPATAVLGISSVLVCIAAAVGLFLYSGIRMQRYDSWKTDVFWMEPATKEYVESLQEAFRSTFAANLIVGIVICIVSVIPFLAAAVAGGGRMELLFPGIGITLFMTGLGVYFFVGAGMRQSCFQVLLQEKDYAKEKKEKKRQRWSKYEDSYWIIVTVIYFLISFWTRKWGVTWILWVLAAGVNNIMGNVMKKGR